MPRQRAVRAGCEPLRVVNVTQLRTVDKERLTERVGQLAPARIRDVLDGLALVFGLDALEG